MDCSAIRILSEREIERSRDNATAIFSTIRSNQNLALMMPEGMVTFKIKTNVIFLIIWKNVNAEIRTHDYHDIRVSTLMVTGIYSRMFAEDKGIVMALIVTGIERSYVERDPRVILMERNEIDEQSVARYERAISEKLCPDERHCPLLLTGRRHDDDDDDDDDDDGPSSYNTS
ncbi:hypothetical protein V1477_007953 [Vespula maculifrons]|uniref:Uncharacterized protein n=1 Tax=Vespula maculifrons TaxID=7453 RepID=A0ABD2CG96_VESMC